MRSSITYMWSRIGARMIRIIDSMMPIGMTMFFHESALKWKRWLSAFFQIDFSYCVSVREWYLDILLDYTTHLMFAGILHILDKRYWGEIYLWSIEYDPAEEFSMSVKKKRENHVLMWNRVCFTRFLLALDFSWIACWQIAGGELEIRWISTLLFETACAVKLGWITNAIIR